MLKHLVDPLHPTREWPADLKLKCEVGQTTIVEFSPASGYLAAGFAEGGIAILDVDTMSVIYRYRQHAMAILGMKWSADARYLVTIGSDWQICIWDLSIKKVIRSIDLDYNPVAVSFDEHNPFRFGIACGTVLKMYDISLDGSKDQVSQWCDPPEGDTIPYTCMQMVAPNLVVVGNAKGMLHFYQGGSASIEEPSQIVKSLKLSTGALRAMTFSFARKILAVACSDKAVRVFYLDDAIQANQNNSVFIPENIEVGHRFTDLGLHSQWNAVTFTQDGEYLYAASDIRGGTIAIWNVLTRFAVRQLRGSYERLTCIKFDQQRVLLIGSGRESGAMFAWRAEAPKAWASLIPEFEHIPDVEVYKETEDDWDLPDRTIRTSPDTDIDVWTPEEPLAEIVIRVEL